MARIPRNAGKFNWARFESRLVGDAYSSRPRFPCIRFRARIEALLAEISANVSNPEAGILGPASASWRINRESALFLGAGRAALLQLAHPWVTAPLVLEHSTASWTSRSTLPQHLSHRLHHGLRLARSGAGGGAPALYTLHTRIRGRNAGERGALGARLALRGQREICALRWVFATLVESAVLAHDCALPPLARRSTNNTTTEWKTLAGLFGLPAASLPENWDGIRRVQPPDVRF